MFRPRPAPAGNPRLAIANCPWLARPGAVSNFQRAMRWAVAQRQGSARSPPLYSTYENLKRANQAGQNELQIPSSAVLSRNQAKSGDSGGGEIGGMWTTETAPCSLRGLGIR